jgi:hypothetical protein
MSKRFIGNIITSNPQEPTENYEDSVASGTWSLQEAFGYIKAGVWPTAGNARPVYIEDVFSTYLYTGNESSQTITTGIDLAGEGGLIWTKARTDSNRSHYLVDTERPINRTLTTSTNNPQQASSGVTSITSTGYTLDSNAFFNTGTFPYVSWTFRKAPRFFDVVSWTGNGSTPTINHNLGIEPAVIIIKALDTDPLSNDWFFWHKDLSSGSFSNTDYANWPAVLTLNSTSSTGVVNGWLTNITSNSFRPTYQRETGVGYVAYLFANDPLGPSGDGSDGLISCGICTADGSGNFSEELGWEPQWVLMKSTGSGIWSIVDNMRGATASSGYTSSKRLQPQSSAVEDQLNSPYGIGFNEKGFTGNLAVFSTDLIYIAIRRGPMGAPTSGQNVFSTSIWSGNDLNPQGVSFSGQKEFVFDLGIVKTRSTNNGAVFIDRLRGSSYLTSETTSAETSMTVNWGRSSNYGTIEVGSPLNQSSRGQNISYALKRAPGFFDVVAYTGDGVNYRNIPHNLKVAPDIIIIKALNEGTKNWGVWSRRLAEIRGANDVSLYLNTTDSQGTYWFVNGATDTTFQVVTFNYGGARTVGNANGVNYVAYLFATLPGVSKVGSYTGNGSSQTIDCGFTSGARFILIKRADSTGDWYIWDSARGIVTGDDPHLSLNTTATEVTNDDSIDPDASGFIVNQVSATNVNVSSASYIFMAIS